MTRSAQTSAQVSWQVMDCILQGPLPAGPSAWTMQNAVHDRLGCWKCHSVHVAWSCQNEKPANHACVARPHHAQSSTPPSHACTGLFKAHTRHETALSHVVRSASARARTAPDMVGEVANTTRKDIMIGISASALVCRGLREPTHGLHGRPGEPARHTHARLAADIRNPSVH